ncbi:NOTCH2 [Branchiostoma lanceolatum]|uniref:chitinase n=1 Tax=Branchiostoma lanceolatum TaxID=7740 RepID=A0A8K0EJB1_BRALA|nr:NOTCH2 [Branchiostoma lanceolatum]
MTQKLVARPSSDIRTTMLVPAVLLSLVACASCAPPLSAVPNSDGGIPQAVERAETTVPYDPAGPSATAVPVIIGTFVSGIKCDGWTFFLVPDGCSSIYYVCSPGQDDPILMHCPANLVFNKDLGVCDWPDHVPYCSCQSGLGGASCQINLDDCSPNPCQNGGFCQNLVGDFVCYCLPSYQGKTCETYVDPCSSGPCQNGGVCSASGDEFTCSCQPGWNGTMCEMEIDECSPNPCQNGGVCQDLVADFSCSCPAPYEGNMCEIYDLDECSSTPCQNGGVCQDLVADFSCSCPYPYEGKMCETYVSTPPPYVPTTAPVITEGAVVPFSSGLMCNGMNFFLLDTDCSHIYYVCSPGYDAPIVMHCPSNLVFNKDLRVCDYPGAVVYC